MKNTDETESQAEMAKRILARKQFADAAAPEYSEHAEDSGTRGDKGMTSTPRTDYPQSGAFDAEGQRPALERSRKVR